ncbi:MAG: phage terminase large subunit family protein [Tabrizicola sp.]
MSSVSLIPPSAGPPASAPAPGASRTFAHRRKVFLVSTPTIRGLSRIEREYEASDQRRFFVPCPHCAAMQWLRFERLRWEKGRPETAEYHCEGCERPIAEHHKTRMLERGEWRPTTTAADPATVGYHLSALYSPVGWLSWQRIARAHEAARGSDEAMRAFRNTILGETWMETGEAPDWQRLADRREAWSPGTVPERGLFLTAGADVQKDRIEVDVWAWGRGLESWLVDHLVLEGGPGDPACWQQLTDLLGRTWAHENGQHLTIARLAIDTGYETSAVYAWSRQVGFAQVAPVKGVEGFTRTSPVTGPTYVDATVGGKRLRRGARLWTVATSTFKAETYRFLRLDRPTREKQAAGTLCPPGTIHLPDWADGEWLKQLTAEQLVTVKGKRGFTRLEWQKLRERNEALDCRVYARAAAWILGADRWPEARWADLETQLGVAKQGGPEAGSATAPSVPTRTMPRRRTVRSSYMR